MNTAWYYVCQIIMLGIIIFCLIQLLGGWDKICDPYLTDSICFDVNFRCQVECGSYDWNSNGVITRTCKCDCGEHIVSFCSGFAYDKKS